MACHCVDLNADIIAKPFREQIASDVKTLDAPPLLVGILANDDVASIRYANMCGKWCEEVGVKFELRKVSSKFEVENAVVSANNDVSVHGILVYYPIFGAGQDEYIRCCVNPLKDVEGLSHIWRFRMYHNVRQFSPQNLKCVLPCTPLAVLKILHYCNLYNVALAEGSQLHGKTITVINRSEVVGRPLAAIMANDGALVYSVDIDSVHEYSRGPGIRKYHHDEKESDKKLEDCLPLSDIVISAVPVRNFKVSTALLKQGVVCVNVSQFRNFEDDVKDRASMYVRAVGKVTNAMLLRNLVRLHGHQRKLVNHDPYQLTPAAVSQQQP